MLSRGGLGDVRRGRAGARGWGGLEEASDRVASLVTRALGEEGRRGREEQSTSIKRRSRRARHSPAREIEGGCRMTLDRIKIRPLSPD